MSYPQDSDYVGVQFLDQGSDLATPSASRIRVYSKSGEIYKRNSAGVVEKFATSAGGMADAVILAPGSSARNVIQPSGDFIPIVAKGHSSQSVSLFEARNSADAVKLSVGFDGRTVIARGTTTSAVPSLEISETYAPTAGAGSDTAIGINTTYNDDRRTNNASSEGLRATFWRQSTATGVPGAGYDSILSFVPILDASLTTLLVGMRFVGAIVASSKTLNEWRAIAISDGSGAGTITTQYGLKIDGLTKATTNYAIYTDAGLVRLGDQLSVVGSADRIQAIFKANGTQTTNLVELQNSSGAVQLAIAGNGRDWVLDTTTGTKIGTATSQKLALWNATPIIQPSSTGETIGFTAGAGTNVTDQSTFTGNVGSTAYRISDIVKHLKNIGAIAA